MTDPDRTSNTGEPRPWELPGKMRRDAEPHRGQLLLRLANAARVCCWLTPLLWFPGMIGMALGIIVTLLASRDLATMGAGMRDREGRLDAEQARAFGLRAVLLGLAALLLCAVPCWGLLSFLLWPAPPVP
jgi:hypothetical protein